MKEKITITLNTREVEEILGGLRGNLKRCKGECRYSLVARALIQRIAEARDKA